jgi:hypothetical protein
VICTDLLQTVPGRHTDIIRHVHPADRAARINEKFGGPRDVFTFRAPLGMQHSILPDRLSLGIGEKWKSIPRDWQSFSDSAGESTLIAT